MALGRPNPISLKRGGIFLFPDLSSVKIMNLYQEKIEYPEDLKLF
jgi:hypothetical protein